MTRNVLFVVGLGILLSGNAVADDESDRGIYVGLGYGIVTVPKADGINFSDADNGNLQLGYAFSENFSIEAQYSTSVSDATAEGTIQDIDVSEIVWGDLMEFNPGMTLSEAMQIWPAAYADIDVDIKASIDTAALYGVYRSSGNLYIKAKAGVVSVDTSLTATPNSIELTVVQQDFSESVFVIQEEDEFFDQFSGGGAEVEVSEKETDFTAGVGIGYKIGSKFFAELEYTMLNDDFDCYSLGVNYRF